MTREELKEHCKRQVENCEMWAKHQGKEPHGKVYEEHKLILELLEQEPILDKIKAEIEHTGAYEQQVRGKTEYLKSINYCLGVIDKYRSGSEE